MRITDIRFQRASFRFLEPMKVAFATIREYNTLMIKVETEEGISGLGEAAPMEFVTGDSLETAVCVGREFRELLLGMDPLAIGEIHRIMDRKYIHNTAVKAAIDMACYDIAAKKMGVPLYQYLGGARDTIESDVTIGIASPEEMAEKAGEWISKGWNIIKVKLGEDISADLERMRRIRNKVGPEAVLRIDANQGWSVKDSIRIIRELEPLHIDLIEQPVAHWDFQGLQEIRNMSGIPIVADESCHSPADAAKLAAMRAADGINIKLMKCGGIYPAMKIAAVAEASGIYCMVGCMGESRIANSAAMHFAAACGNVKKVDLDVVFFTEENQISGGFQYTGGTCHLTDAPGIGIAAEGIWEK